MIRRLLNLLTLLSLLICVAGAALWVRSCFARDGIWYIRGADRYSLHSYRGRVWCWKLVGLRYPEASVWPTPARMGAGFVSDSAPDSWYEQFRGRPKGVRVPGEFLDAPSNGGPVDRHFFGFRYIRNGQWLPRAQLQQGYPTADSAALYAPYWALALVTGVLPGLWLVRRARARNRRRHGLCPTCGYDLRATPGRCPECGTPAAVSATV